MTRESDIDLLVVENALLTGARESVRIGACGFPFDVNVMASQGRFEETKGVIGGIAYPSKVRPGHL